jgi:hypothetical protein
MIAEKTKLLIKLEERKIFVAVNFLSLSLVSCHLNNFEGELVLSLIASSLSLLLFPFIRRCFVSLSQFIFLSVFLSLLSLSISVPLFPFPFISLCCFIMIPLCFLSLLFVYLFLSLSPSLFLSQAPSLYFYLSLFISVSLANTLFIFLFLSPRISLSLDSRSKKLGLP